MATGCHTRAMDHRASVAIRTLHIAMRMPSDQACEHVGTESSLRRMFGRPMFSGTFCFSVKNNLSASNIILLAGVAINCSRWLDRLAHKCRKIFSGEAGVVPGIGRAKLLLSHSSGGLHGRRKNGSALKTSAFSRRLLLVRHEGGQEARLRRSFALPDIRRFGGVPSHRSALRSGKGENTRLIWRVSGGTIKPAIKNAPPEGRGVVWSGIA